VLGVGIDWAEEFHLVALGRPGEGVFEVARVEHDPRSIDGLIARIATLEPDAAEVRVVLETSHGMLVERLIDAGYAVVPVNPDLVARRRGPAKKRDDAEDARIACVIALDRFERLRVLVPHGEEAAELRSITRDDERASRDERRLLNRLRADLIAAFPAALAVAGDDMGAPTFLRLLERWPSANTLVAAPRDEIVAFARACRHGWPDRFADRVEAALASEQFVAREWLVRAKADTIALAATQLLALGAQRRAWERRMGELLLGAPRTGRRQPKAGPPGPTVPGGEIYLSFPGLGDRLAARVAAEIGAITNFDTPNGPAMLRRQSARHSPIRQARARRRQPSRLQRLPPRRRAAVGVLQPARLGLGPGVLRRPPGQRPKPSRHAASLGQPLARSTLALPHPRCRLRRASPRGQPKPVRQSRLTPNWCSELTKGVSSQPQDHGERDECYHSDHGADKRNPAQAADVERWRGGDRSERWPLGSGPGHGEVLGQCGLDAGQAALGALEVDAAELGDVVTDADEAAIRAGGELAEQPGGRRRGGHGAPRHLVDDGAVVAVAERGEDGHRAAAHRGGHDLGVIGQPDRGAPAAGDHH
jgi:hypothetical protein